MENIFSLVNPLQLVNEVNQMEALFQKGLQAYHEKDYFSAHDHWEELWSDYYLKDRLPKKYFYVPIPNKTGYENQ